MSTKPVKTSRTTRNSTTSSASNKNGLLGTFPPEIITNILDQIEPDDHLAAKLTCKSFNAYLQTPFANVMRTKYPKHNLWRGRKATSRLPWECPNAHVATIRAHVHVENSYGRRSMKRGLVCTKCGRIKSSGSFTDTQASTRVILPTESNPNMAANRTCIDCGLYEGNLCYFHNWPFKIWGVKMVVASCCRKVLREDVALFSLYDDGSKARVAHCKPCYNRRHHNYGIDFLDVQRIQRWAATVGRADEFRSTAEDHAAVILQADQEERWRRRFETSSSGNNNRS